MIEFEKNGLWWLPNEPDKQISGNLKYHPLDGIILELVGTFEKNNTMNIGTGEEEIILGITTDNKPITLYKSFVSRQSFSGNMFISCYRTQLLFMGYHFEKAEEIKFSSFDISFDYLEEWTSKKVFDFLHGKDESGRRDKITLTYSAPEEIKISIEDLIVTISNRCSWSTNSYKESNLKNKIIFNISTSGEMSIDILSRNAFLIQNFITFGLGRPTRANFITATNKNAKYEFPKGSIHYENIEIYFVVKELPDTSIKLQSEDMLYTLTDINDALDVYLNNWFSKEVILKPVYDLYFATLNSSSMYLTHEFLNIAQGLESYHRRILSGRYISDDDFGDYYKTLLSSIPSSIPPNFREALKQKFRYMNEFSLRKRLNELINKFSPMILHFISKPDIFISQIVDTRNYLTHFDKQQESKVLSGEQLYWATRRLRVLLEICIMTEIGFPLELIKKLLERNQAMRFLAQK